jgi:hypothetical protein
LLKEVGGVVGPILVFYIFERVVHFKMAPQLWEQAELNEAPDKRAIG